MADPVETKTPWGLLAALILLAAVAALAVTRREPPDPRPADAPAAEFSGTRAHGVLRELLGDGRPHPTGSEANARVRDRIVARLRGLGYSPEIQRGFACSAWATTCAQVENVVARLEGTQRGGAVLLMAHYDSVPAGPGAGDDMAGVASVLEVARALKSSAPPRNTVIFLLEDGEEAGLLGAQLFADSPAAAEVRTVVNLEARGTSGPSMMFETIGDDALAVSLYGSGAPYPITSSVFSTIYELMPNNTDLTVFKTRGVSGLNFAFVGEPGHYHTSLDTLENVSVSSLQHHGDNALAAVRSLAASDDLARPPAGDKVFFDILGLTVVSWPKGWTLAIAILALLLVLAAVVLAFRRGLTGGGIGFGVLAFLGTIVLAGIAGYGMSTIASGASSVPWVANPVPLLAAFWLMPLAVVGFVSASLGDRAGSLGLWAGVWLGWSLLGLVLVLAGLPGISYLFVVPALVAGAAGLVSRGPAAFLLPVLVAGILWFPILVPLYGGLGSGGLLPIALLMAILLAALAPFFAAAPGRLAKGVAAAAAVLAVALLGVAAASRPFSEDSPQPVTLQLYQDADSGQARWILRSPPPVSKAILGAASFAQQPERPFPWSPEWARAMIAPAPALPVSGPELTVLEDTPANGKRRLRLRLTSPRGAPNGILYIPEAARLESLRIDGHPVAGEGGKLEPAPGWYRVSYLTLPPQGVELEMVLAEAAPQDWYVTDSSYGLPPSGEALAKARGPEAAPMQDGDTVLVSRKVRI
ncbi:MAG TPA: M20/M25/M40 family metallo-hydrolase [Thermoanaerobaculia bacterium]